MAFQIAHVFDVGLGDVFHYPNSVEEKL